MTASKTWNPNDDWGATLALAVAEYSEDVDFQILPEGFRVGLSEFPEGLFFGYGYPQERRFSGSGKLHYRGFEAHRLMLELSASRIEADDFFLRANFDQTTFAPLGDKQRFTGDGNFLEEGAPERTILSAVVQDEISIGSWLTVTLGGRFDDYSDIGANFSPRVAAVARAAGHHSFKAQYAEAFRPPSFLELFSRGLLFTGDSDLEPETVRTFELAHIYNTGPTVLRTTLFHSDLKNSIGRGTGGFVNGQQQRLRGVEFDGARKLGRFFSTEGAVSFVDTDDDETGAGFPDVASWTANLSLRATPWPNHSYAVEYRYLGKRERRTDDDRGDLRDEHVIDLSARVDRLFRTGFGLRLGIRNVFGADVLAPAPGGTYSGDYPRPGREFWGSLRYEF